jgi:hypothetical protein
MSMAQNVTCARAGVKVHVRRRIDGCPLLAPLPWWAARVRATRFSAIQAPTLGSVRERSATTLPVGQAVVFGVSLVLDQLDADAQTCRTVGSSALCAAWLWPGLSDF